MHSRQSRGVTAPLDPGLSEQPGQCDIDPALAERIRNVINKVRVSFPPKATIVRVTAGDQEIITEAFGDAMTGVPATTDMHFRNGAVAISYVATLLLQLVDEKKLSTATRGGWPSSASSSLRTTP